MNEKPWTLAHRKWTAPMSRAPGGGKLVGYFRCVAFDFRKGVRFKTKELALQSLDRVAWKYGIDSAKKWKPMRWDELLKRASKLPRTKKLLYRKLRGD